MSGFTFRWPLALILGVLLIAGAVWLVLWLTRRSRNTPQATVWDLFTVLKDRTSGSQFRTYRIAVVASVSLVCVSLLAALGLAARPSTVNESETASASRDIVLCLDVSGSALPFDREVIATYLDLVQNFRSERIGLSIFNSTSKTVFPLTNDYTLVTEQLTSAMDALKGVQTQADIDAMSDAQYQAISDWLAGTQNRKDATSLIGDGLVNCATMIPNFSPTASDAKRSTPASIVFASDNVLSGSPIYSLQEALDITAKNAIHVDALFTGPAESVANTETQDMKTRVEAGGGTFQTRSDSDSVDHLVRSIESESNRSAQNDSSSQMQDDPALWIGLLMALTAGFVVIVGWVRR